MVDMNNLNLNLLRFFIATAESKSLVEAGEKLGYSHSTVSTNISTLEKQLGVKLFNRNPLELTDVGKDIYITVKSGFTDINFAGVIANSKNSMEQGKISIGCPSHILDFYLMKKIAQVVKDYPNFKINLDTSYECEDLIVALKQNKIDFAYSLGKGFGEIWVIEIDENMNIAEHKISSLRLSSGIKIGAILRDDKIIYPSNSEILHLGDTILIYANSGQIRRAEQIFA